MNFNRYIIIACLFILNISASDLKNMSATELSKKRPIGFDVYKYRGIDKFRMGGKTFMKSQPEYKNTEESNMSDNDNENK